MPNSPTLKGSCNGTASRQLAVIQLGIGSIPCIGPKPPMTPLPAVTEIMAASAGTDLWAALRTNVAMLPEGARQP